MYYVSVPNKVNNKVLYTDLLMDIMD